MVSRSWSKAFLALEFFIHLSLQDPRKLPWVLLGDRQFALALVLQLTSSCGWFSVMNSDKLVSNIRRFGVRTLLIPKALHIYCNWLEKIFLFVLSTSCSSSFFPFLFISMLPAHEPAKAVSNLREQIREFSSPVPPCSSPQAGCTALPQVFWVTVPYDEDKTCMSISSVTRWHHSWISYSWYSHR